MKNYYEILKIPQDASHEQIKKVYRSLVQIYHPDRKVLDEIHANEEMKEINEAYNVLSDPDRRAQYDAQLERTSTPHPQVSSTTLDFGTVERGEHASQTFEIQNLGKRVVEINFSYSEEESWFDITDIQPFSEDNPCPLRVTVTANTQTLEEDRAYRGWIEVDFDGVTAQVNLVLRVAVEPESASFLNRSSIASQITDRHIALIALFLLGLAGGGFLIASFLPTQLPPMMTPVSPTAVLTPTPQPGQIIYTVQEEGHLMLYTAQADGTDVQSLGVSGWAPAWSPDGDHVAFISDRSGTQQLYVTTAQSNSISQLTHSPGEKSSPGWSPDGRRIGFISHGITGSQLHWVDRDGTDHQIIDDGRVGAISHFAWSPNGQQILFDAKQDGELRVYKSTVESTELQVLTDFDSWWPAWSPDGKRIAISSEMGIYTLDEHGLDQLRLTTFRGWAPSWSQTGQWIAFLSDRGLENQSPELWLMDANGRNQSRLTGSGCWAQAWSSNARWLACAVGDIEEQSLALRILIVDIETREQWEVANISTPNMSWKP